MREVTQRLLEAGASLRRGWRSILEFQLWFGALSAVIFGPGLAWLLNRLVGASGSLAVSNYELAGFFLSVPGMCFLAAFSTLSLALLFLNNAGLVMIAGAIRNDRPVSPLRLLNQNLFRFPKLATLGAWVLLSVFVLAVPCVTSFWIIFETHLGEADINYYLSQRPPEWLRAQWLAGTVLGVFGMLGGWIALRWSVAIQYALYSDLSPLNCLRESWRLTRRRWFSLLRVLATWWVGLTLVSVAIGFVYSLISHAVLEGSGLELRWVVPVVAIVSTGYMIGGFAYGVVGGGVNELLLTNYFFDHVNQSVTYPTVSVGADSTLPYERAFRRVAWIAAMVAVVGAIVGAAGALASVRTDQQPLVTAHRGSSAVAPENSLSALKLAIEHHSDFAEIDVQHTADGHIVLMHDADFMRISGQPYQLEKVTLRQARQFDISGKFKSEFGGEQIGTLQEAIDLVRGKMKLNIELKYNRKDPELAGDVVALILRNDFADQCVLTSLDLDPLLEIEEKWPGLETGLIVTAVVGDVTRIPVDFYSLNFARATPAFISLAHKRGKDVHVWTINSVEQMNQMIELGADNLITDVPDEVRQLLEYRSRLTKAERVALRLRNALLHGY